MTDDHSGEVVLLVTQRVHPDRHQEARAALAEMVQAVHARDEGCRLYALHGVAGDPSRLIMIERWASRAALEAHAGRPHVAALAHVEALDGPPEITVLEPLTVGDPVKGSV